MASRLVKGSVSPPPWESSIGRTGMWQLRLYLMRFRGSTAFAG